ncbi:hypothetical protein VWM78_09900, partial [Campylobacter coli]
ALNEGKIVVVAGFQGVDKEGDVTTLGRGGSDLSAVAVAGALKPSSSAKACISRISSGRLGFSFTSIPSSKSSFKSLSIFFI